MEVRIATSDVRPVELVTGPTVTLYRRDIETSTETDEEGAERTVHRYRELCFPRGQYELVCAGMLPPGVTEWTEDLRRIQRRALLEEADRLIAEANDYIEAHDDGSAEQAAWGAYRTAVRAYKMGVRATVDAEGFPAVAEYPELPEQPL